jgi:hypothetical protein
MMKRSRVQQRAPVDAKVGQRLRSAFGVAQRRLRELDEERRVTRLEIAELRRVIADQTKQIEMLTSKVESVTKREEELRAMLLSAHDQLMRRADEIRTTLTSEMHRLQAQPQQNAPQQNASEARASVLAPAQSPVPGEYSEYQQLSKLIYYRRLIGQIREAARSILPSEATVIVVSKGDDELLELDGRQGWHFPQNENGVYAGYYPKDSAQAIAHLEELREKGAEFLLFPGTALWWLVRYEDFGQHLDSHYTRLWSDDTCVIYRLSKPQLDDAEEP